MVASQELWAILKIIHKVHPKLHAHFIDLLQYQHKFDVETLPQALIELIMDADILDA